MTNAIQTARELSELGGILIPANDPEAASPCGILNPDELALYVGNMAAKAHRFPLTVLKIAQRPAIVIDRNQDGSINLSMDVRTRDNRVVLRINRNGFEIAPGNYLAMKRPDRSTIIIEDPYGNKMMIRYMNQHTFRASGKLSYVDRTIDLEGNIPISGVCVDVLHGPEGAAVIGFE